MSVPSPLDAAMKRLTAALDHLEAASERRAGAEARRADMEEELSVMQDDRARLAVELDGAVARVKSLELAHAEAMRRLENAGTRIRLVLGEDGTGGEE